MYPEACFGDNSTPHQVDNEDEQMIKGNSAWKIFYVVLSSGSHRLAAFLLITFPRTKSISHLTEKTDMI